MFAPYLDRWSLISDGEPILTHSSRLLPVRWRDRPAMLKVATDKDERYGALLMQWWDGHGAAHVYAHEGDAVLLERATGKRSLLAMAMNGEDDEASRILCRTAARLHAPRQKPLPDPIPLTRWFRDLEPAAKKHGGTLTDCWSIADTLLADLRDVTVLHGDIHHGNILDFESRGWLAIDPKRLHGERGFDSPISLPTRNCQPSPIRLVSAASSPSSRQRLGWSRSGFCGGSQPIPAFPPLGSSAIRTSSRPRRP
ncbi:antibiotic resistance (streptomycin kinase) protein [Rhizobium phaseoli Ch24-10]|nr:antibiotic resistance (streptomycin kinase) protein [Rhizobium phaseoli Ch24-10]